MLCNLLSKIARAAVDDQILCALFILVKFDEVVAAAKRAKRALHTTLPLKPLASIHSEVGQRACRVAVNLEAGGHGTLNIAVELDKVRAINALGKLDAEHPAADVHAHQIGNQSLSFSLAVNPITHPLPLCASGIMRIFAPSNAGHAAISSICSCAESSMFSAKTFTSAIRSPFRCPMPCRAYDMGNGHRRRVNIGAHGIRTLY